MVKHLFLHCLLLGVIAEISLVVWYLHGERHCRVISPQVFGRALEGQPCGETMLPDDSSGQEFFLPFWRKCQQFLSWPLVLYVGRIHYPYLTCSCTYKYMHRYISILISYQEKTRCLHAQLLQGRFLTKGLIQIIMCDRHFHFSPNLISFQLIKRSVLCVQCHSSPICQMGLSNKVS